MQEKFKINRITDYEIAFGLRGYKSEYLWENSIQTTTNVVK